MELKVIAHIRSDFSTKFGVPRQSGLVDALEATIVFTPEYRNADALRGLEGFSHLWLLWHFSEAEREGWSPTVRPPRLGGNKRLGVFATRSPYRPNPIALSSVQLEKIEWQSPEGPRLHIRGADLMDGTPIFDIKPYLSYTDSHPEASGGFAFGPADGKVDVCCPKPLLELLPPQKRKALISMLEQDPRPGYAKDPQRVFGLEFAGFDIHFRVEEKQLTVCSIEPK